MIGFRVYNNSFIVMEQVSACPAATVILNYVCVMYKTSPSVSVVGTGGEITIVVDRCCAAGEMGPEASITSSVLCRSFGNVGLIFFRFLKNDNGGGGIVLKLHV